MDGSQPLREDRSIAPIGEKMSPEIRDSKNGDRRCLIKLRGVVHGLRGASPGLARRPPAIARPGYSRDVRELRPRFKGAGPSDAGPGVNPPETTHSRERPFHGLSFQVLVGVAIAIILG